jgi:murein DD-endopeptidase MepM/ murein hydrolase activator NlpD
MKLKQESALSASFGLIRMHGTAIGLFVLVFLAAGFSPQTSFGDTAEELQQKISDRNTQIAALEKEINQYENSLVALGSAKKTLEGEVKRLDISRKKMGADIAVTENKISAAQFRLEELGGAIDDKEKRIANGKSAINKSLVTLNMIGDTTLVENLLSANGLTEAWVEADKLRSLESTLSDEIKDLAATKEALTVNFNEVEAQKKKLLSLKRDLSGQKAVLDQNRKEQALLLSQTKNQESEFQKILAQKQTAKLEFEQELRDFEAQLQYTLDPSKLPSAGTGVMMFPLDTAFMSRCRDRVSTFKNLYCITQYFGNTAFAQSGAYNGKGHNGVDFGAPEGTKVIAALSGVVEATGNTDLYKSCYSYGKWVLIRHGNGLSSLYAHLSIIGVNQGDAIPTGGIVGYSGKTGYATGPHLHFTLYATDGVKLVRLGDLKAKTNCANALVPVAPTGAYLNPMQYL